MGRRNAIVGENPICWEENRILINWYALASKGNEQPAKGEPGPESVYIETIIKHWAVCLTFLAAESDEKQLIANPNFSRRN